MNKTLTAGLVGFVVGGAVGAVATYFTVKKKLDERYSQIADDEIKIARDLYKDLAKGLEAQTISSVIKTVMEKPDTKAYTDKLNDLGYSEDDESDEDEAELDISEEASAALAAAIERSPERPYIISTDEFMEDDTYTKIMIAYFEEDGTLCDDRDTIIPDIESTVGLANLGLFGYGDFETDTLYIRNEKKEADFEVTREEGSYANMILGLEQKIITMKDGPRIKKMRDDD